MHLTVIKISPATCWRCTRSVAARMPKARGAMSRTPPGFRLRRYRMSKKNEALIHRPVQEHQPNKSRRIHPRKETFREGSLATKVRRPAGRASGALTLHL